MSCSAAENRKLSKEASYRQFTPARRSQDTNNSKACRSAAKRNGCLSPAPCVWPHSHLCVRRPQAQIRTTPPFCFETVLSNSSMTLRWRAGARTSANRWSMSALGRSHTSRAPIALADQPPELEDAPLLVARMPGTRGRGLVAKRRIAEGEHVLRERFFVGAPRTMRNHQDLHDELLLVSALQKWRPTMHLDAQLHKDEKQFPRLVLRIAERILDDFLRDPEARAARTWGRVRQLCRANVTSMPQDWHQDFQAIRAAMCRPASSCASRPASAEISINQSGDVIPCDSQLFDLLFSEEWFSQVMGMLHLNTFRLQSPHTLGKDPPTTISCLFLAASLINHSCAPNLSISAWDAGASHPQKTSGDVDEKFGPVIFVAARDIAIGEECTSESWRFMSAIE